MSNFKSIKEHGKISAAALMPASWHTPSSVSRLIFTDTPQMSVAETGRTPGGTMGTDKAIVTLILGVFVTLVSMSAGQAETQFYYCKQTMQYGRNANEPSGIDPVQLNFVVKDGAFSMDEVRFNGKVSIGETEVTAFVDNVRYEGFVSLLHTSPTAAELTMSIMDKSLYQQEPKVTTGTCGVHLR